MNFPIEVYTIIIECLLIFYFFHKEVRPVYPSRRYIILFCISLFAVIMLSTLYTPMFIRLVIISLFLFLCYTFCFKCKIFQITYTIILFFVKSGLAEGSAFVKKYFTGKVPHSHRRNLLSAILETVDSCTFIIFENSRCVSGAKCPGPFKKNSF